jgi:hypothetical protein
VKAIIENLNTSEDRLWILTRNADRLLLIYPPSHDSRGMAQSAEGRSGL